MHQTDVLCAGIIVADHVCTPIERVPNAGELVIADGMLLTIGGCAANAAVDLAKMGVRASVVGRVGDDVFGRIVTDMLREQGVDVSSMLVSDGADTSQTLIINVKGQDRRFVHTFGANGQFRAEDIPIERLAAVRILYVGGYLLTPNMQAEALQSVFAEAKRLGVKTVLDVAIPKPDDYLARLKSVLPHVDVFLPNQDEAKLLSGKTDPVAQAEYFCSLGCETTVVTAGQDGAVLVDSKQRLRAAAFPMEFVDGAGGGDAFDAGFICGMLNDGDAEECLRYGSALGASCVRSIGTTPGVFTKAECDEFLEKNTLKIDKV